MEEVNMWYDKGKPIEVHSLKKVSLEIEKGDYAAFFGPSGSGKTTALYAIAGIDRYQEGKILINGQDITGLSNKELAIFRQTGIGIIFQQFNLVPSLTVLENVALPMAFIGVSSEKARVEAQKLLDRLNIGAFKDRYPSELSGGQQQRVGIARALANNPPIIVADEPLGNLDSANAKNVLEFLKELNEKDGRTIIMVTHEAWSLRDVKTVFYMKDGSITSVEHQTAKTAADSLVDHLYKELEPEKGKPAETVAPATTASSVSLVPLESLSARFVANFLMRGYSMDETRRFEHFLNERLQKNIDAVSFQEWIDKPYKDGGVGLWKNKAVRLATYVESIIDKRHDIDAIHRIIEARPELPIDEEAAHIRAWLLDGSKLRLTDMQKTILDQVVSDRLRNYISTKQFTELLSLSKKTYGVGLTFRASERLTEKMETALSSGHESNESMKMLPV